MCPLRPADLQRSKGGVTRRRFLQRGMLGSVVATLPTWRGVPEVGTAERAGSAILILNVGGPSHLDTWDPKPAAPAEIRGPYRPIRTRVAGIWLSELCPHQAQWAEKMALVRACHHTAPASHEVGWHLAETGNDLPCGSGLPTIADVAHRLWGRDARLPAHVDLPQQPRRFEAGHLGERVGADEIVAGQHDAIASVARLAARESRSPHTRYGPTRFGRNCLLARCLIEAGVRVVTIRTFADFREPHSWDVHGGPHFSTVEQMRHVVAPMYDQAYAALLNDLTQRGLLDNTLVCSLAEFGRTPRLNPAGGRDHWPHCWTVTFAGGGVRGGQTIGASDKMASEPAERPVIPAEITGSIYHSLGVRPWQIAPLDSAPTAPPTSPIPHPIAELF